MTITVIGHLCIDRRQVSTAPERFEERFGGIIYSLTTLANVMAEGDTIVPVFGVGHAEYDDLLKLLRRYPNIDISGVYPYDGPTNSVMLFYNNGGERRIECSKHIAAPIPFERIKPHLDADGILINMVSGFDISLETLDAIRMSVRDRGTPIHFDFHSLTLGVDEKATRFRRPIIDWRRWCFFMNSIQMSEEEAKSLTAERYDEPTLANQLMPLMVNALVLTRGARGVTLITQAKKKLTKTDIAGVPVQEIVDPTGCGDVFGAVFFHTFLKTGDYLASATFANTIAALNATVRGAEGIDTLRDRLTTVTPA
ncbi:MAG: carbohydrate kinase family protein [Bacteroidota bacterium]